MSKLGDYVLATKYTDGDPGDHFAIGWLKEVHARDYGGPRFIVVDEAGRAFRANGFRRVQTISAATGAWLLERFPEIEATPMRVDDNEQLTGKSVWDWLAEAPV